MINLIFNDRFIEHKHRFGHPECPERLMSIKERLESEGLFTNLLEHRGATDEDLEMVHTSNHVHLLKYFGEGFLDPDTYSREETFDIACLSAGAGLSGADRMMEKNEPFFSLGRPPGHHAGKDYFGGFCYFNNIAVTAEYMIKKHGLKRVLIFDPDAHHGNGTMDIFKARNDVLYISTHHWGIFPGTGRHTDVGIGKGEGFSVNLPLLEGMGNHTYQMAMDRIIEPVIRQYKPEAILVSYGIDGHQADMLAGLDLTSDLIIDLAKKCDELSKEYCSGRLGLFLEGGYDLNAIAEVTAGTVAYFNEQELKKPLEYTQPSETEANSEHIDALVEVQRRYWKL